MSQTAELIELAKEIASATPDFPRVRGPGMGDRATYEFMGQLGRRAQQKFGEDLSERRICGDTGFAVDFYIPAEETIIEVALGLPNSASEFEKDILKAIISVTTCHGLFSFPGQAPSGSANSPGARRSGGGRNLTTNS